LERAAKTWHGEWWKYGGGTVWDSMAYDPQLDILYVGRWSRPARSGAHDWYPMSFSPLTGLVYLPALESASYYKHDDKFEFRDRTWNTGLSATRDPANEKTVADAAKSTHGAFLIAGIQCGSRRHAASRIRARATAARLLPAATSCSRARSTAISLRTRRTQARSCGRTMRRTQYGRADHVRA
jgi:hypothetical protein